MILIFHSIGHWLSDPSLLHMSRGDRPPDWFLMKIIRMRVCVKGKSFKSFSNLLSLMLHILDFCSRPFVSPPPTLHRKLLFNLFIFSLRLLELVPFFGFSLRSTREAAKIKDAKEIRSDSQQTTENNDFFKTSFLMETFSFETKLSITGPQW